MFKKIFLALAILIFMVHLLSGQGYKNSQIILTGKTTVEITFYSPSIVRVTRYPGIRQSPQSSFSVIKHPDSKVVLKRQVEVPDDGMNEEKY